MGLTKALELLQKEVLNTSTEITVMKDGTFHVFWNNVEFRSDVKNTVKLLEALRFIDNLDHRSV